MICDIAVLDYTDGRVYIYRCAPTMTGEELEAFVESKGHHVSSCEYMAYAQIEIVERGAVFSLTESVNNGL